ncbi:ABC transporter substrate-binding protein [Oceanivirga salmonicida]|uniref:ABC transporter substrate-binding protein n=1 Tax=Oceanivirga salmonicida TaxID=1769291 RepID=UPI0012E0D0B8|nr:ABC transporter substrate-binding protein [Oceanivirga salmonicida]
MKKRLFSLFIGLLVILTVSCGSKNDETTNNVKTETLTMYIGVVEEQALKIAQEFEKDSGIKVEFVRMSGGQILSRVRAEKDAPKASIWYGGPADSFVAAKSENLLQAYISPNASKIKDSMKDKDGYWTGIYTEVLGFILDKRWFEETGNKMPKTWDDILKPEFEKQIVVANPGSSGTAFLLLSGFIQDRGEEKGLDYMVKLNKNIKQYTKSGSAPAKSAALGEAAIGITFIHNGMRHMEEGFENLQVVAPEDGTWGSTAAVGIIAGAPELEAAKKFVDWALTKDAQEIGQQFKSYQFPTNPDAKIPPKAAPFKDLKLNSYNLEWSGEHRAELVEKWDKMIKNLK